jgi:hypothetical protein
MHPRCTGCPLTSRAGDVVVMPEPFHAETVRVLPQLRIDELLDELQGRVASVRSSRDRVRKLLEAVIAIGSGLDAEAALTKIVQAATVLVDARYGALGVIGEDQRLARFITVGMSQAQIAAIGAYPEGHGLLGELIRHPVPLRVAELGAHAAVPRFSGEPPADELLRRGAGAGARAGVRQPLSDREGRRRRVRRG